MKGLLVVLSSPSGGGKTTIIKKLLERGNPSFVYSISTTTRPARKGERDGKDYYFVSPEKFNQLIENDQLVEHAMVHGFNYGTSLTPLLNYLAEGAIVVMDLDVMGAKAIREKFPKNSLLIFVRPPSLEILKERLTERHTENKTEIQMRLQRAAMEMSAAPWFDYIVINRRIEETVEEIEKIINSKQSS